MDPREHLPEPIDPVQIERDAREHAEMERQHFAEPDYLAQAARISAARGCSCTDGHALDCPERAEADFATYLATHREFQRLERQSLKLASARAALPPGSTRARVTTANARWARVAEARDLLRRQLREEWERQEAPAPPKPRKPRRKRTLDERINASYRRRYGHPLTAPGEG